MKVLLYQSVDGLGNTGDIVEVADGYARNSLIPRRLAAKATAGVVAEAERMQKAWADNNAAEKAAATQVAERLGGSSLDIPAKVGQEGKLFGSVGAREIADALTLETGVDIDRKMVSVDEAFRSVGSYPVSVQPHPEVSFDITVQVVEA